MAHPGRTKWIGGTVGALLLLVVLAGPSYAQLTGDGGGSSSSSSSRPPTTPPPTLLPVPTTTTSTTSTTTAPPAPKDPPPAASDPEQRGSPPDTSGSGAGPDGAGGEADGPITWGTVPAEAQAVIDSVVRTPPNSSEALHAAVGRLVDLGLTREEAIHVGFGRFPVAGVANYTHDWLFPRYGPGFRFHKGTDVFAPLGTPLRAMADGTARAGSSSLGGLTVKILTDDGTSFYYAHLSGLVDGFVDGMEVRTGDVIGYVGDSGNARGGAPHLHLGVYPQGGEATDPKPLLDGFLRDAMEQLPAIVERIEQEQAAASPPRPESPSPRSMLGTALLRPVTDRPAGAGLSTEILYQASGNPSAGGASIARSEAGHLAGSIDWESWQARAELERDLVRRGEAVLHFVFGDR